MIKAVLFDFDGTLINTNELIFKSYEVAFWEVFKRKIEMDEILTLYGKPLYSSLMQYGAEKGERLYNIYREYNEANHDILAKPFDGVYEGIINLLDNGYKIGIVTSKRIRFVLKGIDILKLTGMFDVIITPDDTEETKPHPAPVLLGCKKLGVAPEEAIYVGDSVFDLAAGKAANTKLCAVGYSVTPKDKLMEYNPEYFVDSIKELSDLLGDCQCH